MAKHRRSRPSIRRQLFEIRLLLENRWHVYWKPAIKKAVKR